MSFYLGGPDVGDRVLVTGDRNWDDELGLWAALDERHAWSPIYLLIHGGAKGADSAAGRWSMDRLGGHHRHPARWDEFGRAAGPIRNQEMLDDLPPDVVLAFHDHLLVSKGTRDMVVRALKEGISVVLYAHRVYDVRVASRTLTSTLVVEGQDDERPSGGGNMAMWRSSAAQTANNDAAAVVSRAIEAGQFDVSKAAGRKAALELFDEVRDHVQENLEVFLTQDDEAFEERNSDSGSSGRKKSGSKGKSSRSGGKMPKTVEEALKVKVGFGAFKGETLETILEVDTETADDDYGYGDGERDGTDYIGWLAGSAEDKKVRKAAELVAEENDIEVFEPR